MSSNASLPGPFLEYRCQHVYSDGRRCTMFRMGRNSTLCLQHWAKQREKGDPEWAVDDIMNGVRDLKTVEEIHDVLGRLFRHVVYNRIPPRKAGLLVYICQMLLATLPRSQDGALPQATNGELPLDASPQQDLPQEADLRQEEADVPADSLPNGGTA
jgi:hypothetical protein